MNWTQELDQVDKQIRQRKRGTDRLLQALEYTGLELVSFEEYKKQKSLNLGYDPKKMLQFVKRNALKNGSNKK